MLKTECSRNCWVAAAVAGVLVWLFNAFAGLFLGGILLGLLVFWILGSLLVWLACDGRGGPAESIEVLGPERALARPTPDSGPLFQTENAIANAGSIFAARSVEVANRGRDRLRQFRGAKAGELDNLATAAVPQHPDVVTPPPEADDDHATPAADAGRAVVDEHDLKQIRGIGPQLEKTLNDHGVTSLWQIAGWDEDAIERHAALIGRMGGRIRSDEWVAQARALLATGRGPAS